MAGTAAINPATPAAAASAIAAIPTAVPSTCGSVRRNPNVAPDAHSSTLFGPGVAALTNANPTRPRTCSMAGTVPGEPAAVLYDSAHGPARAPPPRSPPGGRPSPASARSSTRGSRSTRTRATRTTPGPCSSSTPAPCATTSGGTSGWPPRRWCPPPAARRARRAAGDRRRLRDAGAVPRDVDASGSLIGAAVDRPFIDDLSLRRRVEAVHEALLEPDGALEAETRLHLVTERIEQLLGRGRRTPASPSAEGDPGPRRGRACGARRLGVRTPVVRGDRVARVGPAAAARAFRATFGLPPHEYVLGRSRPPAPGCSTACRPPMSPRRPASPTRRTSPAGSVGWSGPRPVATRRSSPLLVG